MNRWFLFLLCFAFGLINGQGSSESPIASPDRGPCGDAVLTKMSNNSDEYWNSDCFNETLAERNSSSSEMPVTGNYSSPSPATFTTEETWEGVNQSTSESNSTFGTEEMFNLTTLTEEWSTISGIVMNFTESSTDYAEVVTAQPEVSQTFHWNRTLTTVVIVFSALVVVLIIIAIHRACNKKGGMEMSPKSPQAPACNGLKISYDNEVHNLPNPTYHVTDFDHVNNASKPVDPNNGAFSEIFGNFWMPNERIQPKEGVPVSLQMFR